MGSVYARYSNIENGIIAQQNQNKDDYLINSASYHIDIYSLQNDSLLKHGELGRIVVTDFFNKGMPLIKYDTGDVGRLKGC